MKQTEVIEKKILRDSLHDIRPVFAYLPTVDLSAAWKLIDCILKIHHTSLYLRLRFFIFSLLFLFGIVSKSKENQQY